MSNGKQLTRADIDWAWDRWKDGYRQKDIAKALGVCCETVCRRLGKLQDERGVADFGWKKTRNLPPLRRHDGSDRT